MKNKLILGSNSPRRAQLLTDLGYEFQVRASHVDEKISLDIPIGENALHLAIQKNEAISRGANEIVITADTTVVLANEILNKPRDKTDAHEMISRLSGFTHEVITGVCIKGLRQVSFSSMTLVKFKSLSEAEISFHLNSNDYLDKAGGYGIQDWIGRIGIDRIEGCYYNVVGLPTQMVFQSLTTEFGLFPDQ